MRPILARAAAAALLLFSSAVQAGGLDQFRDFLAGTRSARGEFTQQVMRSSGQVLESTSGGFAFARPGRFRWEVRKPFEQLLVADGERLWFYDKDLNQVTVRALSDSLGSTPAAILFGASDLDREFVTKELGPRDGLEWLEAVPRSKDAGFERIAIGFRGGLPEAMEVKDAFGRTSVFRFRAIERNAAVAADAFRFTPPKGADLVRQ